jgi:tRNA (cmo5U34)-methyltransferase
MKSVGDNIKTSSGLWSFGSGVAEVFDQHVMKSVPLYREGHTLISDLSEHFLGDGGLAYEIGCSTGALLDCLATRYRQRNVRFIGIDTEREMLVKAENRLKNFQNITLSNCDATELDFDKCNIVIFYYTLQFIKRERRLDILRKAFSALELGGALFLFEKVRAKDAHFQDLMTSVYIDFKSANGFSDDEILGKSRSLRSVLDPLSTEENFALLAEAGFRSATTVLKYSCFEGILAIK